MAMHIVSHLIHTGSKKYRNCIPIVPTIKKKKNHECLMFLTK